MLLNGGAEWKRLTPSAHVRGHRSNVHVNDFRGTYAQLLPAMGMPAGLRTN